MIGMKDEVTGEMVLTSVSSGLPIGFVFPWPSTTLKPYGCLMLNGGLASRETYPKLWDFARNSNNIVDDVQWLGLASTQTSVGHFSRGDGLTTFRLPQIFDYVRGFDGSGQIGDFQDDALQNITGNIYSSTSSSFSGGTGAFTAPPEH